MLKSWILFVRVWMELLIVLWFVPATLATSLAPMLPASPFRVCASRIAPSASLRAIAARMRAAASLCVSRKRVIILATSFSLR